MVSTQNLLPFVSILFLVLVELSGRVDDLSTLTDTAINRDGTVLGLYPDIGFLTIVHGVNVFLMMVGYLIVALEFLTTGNIVVTIIYITMVLFLFIIPYMELEEYDVILDTT